MNRLGMLLLCLCASDVMAVGMSALKCPSGQTRQGDKCVKAVIKSNVVKTKVKVIHVNDDSDGDGLNDNIDQCPEEAGEISNYGCPKRQPSTGKGNSGMVSIPAGCFFMGDDTGEKDESPRHRVCLPEFQMDRTEVTQSQYLEVVGRSPHFNDGSCYVWTGSEWKQGPSIGSEMLGDSKPVMCVDWAEASNYCKALGKRLPTEAEWEYAARAGTTSKWYWGNSESDAARYAWYDGNSKDQVHPVGQKSPNAWGLYDMAGNVWEWTADWYDATYYSSSPSQNPKGAASGSDRVFRGGGWSNYFASYLLSSNRSGNGPSYRGSILGFRCALSSSNR